MGLELIPVLGSQPAGDSMHSHQPGGGLPLPPTATHMHSHKPGGRLRLLSARPSVTSTAVGVTTVRPVPTYTAW